MAAKHNDSDLTERFQSLDQEMEQKRGQETPFDSKAVFHQLTTVRQQRQRRRRWAITGCTMGLLLTLGTIGFHLQPNAGDSPITAKQESPSTSQKPNQPTLAETIANDPELLAAQLVIAQEHQARLELIALRQQNAMNAPSLIIDPSLLAKLHAEAWSSVEMPDITEILSGKYTTDPYSPGGRN